LRAVYEKWAWLARRRLAVDGGVLNITAAVWTAGLHWWRSDNKKQTQNVSEYMLVLALCLVLYVSLIGCVSLIGSMCVSDCLCLSLAVSLICLHAM